MDQAVLKVSTALVTGTNLRVVQTKTKVMAR